jgi:hypothetical protein
MYASDYMDYFTVETTPHTMTKTNGSILNAAAVVKNLVASAAETEVGACFQNSQSGAPLIVTLIELGHQKPAAPLRTDNSTALGILNETIKQKRSKAMDMRYQWLTERVCHKQFDICWYPGKTILGIIITHIIQRNITKICAHLSYIRLITYMFCKGVLKYCSPSRARVQTHRQANAP